MAAATGDRNETRQPSERVNYIGASGWIYYKETMVIRTGTGVIRPAASAGFSSGKFLGVMNNSVHRLTDSGASQAVLDIWKTGEFTFAAQGTGVSADIGKAGYIIDDQTVGVSVGFPALLAGEIVAIPTSSTYRVRIDNAVGRGFISGLSGVFEYIN